jgi:hypothetical protein
LLDFSSCGSGGLDTILAVVTFGIGFGVANLVKLTMLADRYDTTAYATIAGILTTPSRSPKRSHRSPPPGYSPPVATPLVLATTGAACLLAAVGILVLASSPTTLPADQLVGAVARSIRSGAEFVAALPMRADR